MAFYHAQCKNIACSVGSRRHKAKRRHTSVLKQAHRTPLVISCIKRRKRMASQTVRCILYIKHVLHRRLCNLFGRIGHPFAVHKISFFSRIAAKDVLLENDPWLHRLMFGIKRQPRRGVRVSAPSCVSTPCLRKSGLYVESSKDIHHTGSGWVKSAGADDFL